MERSEQVGKAVRTRWEELAADVEEVGEIRGIGAMIGVEFVADRATKEPNEAYLGALISGCMARGLIAVSCGVHHNVLRHLIPLVITDEELDEALDVMAEAALGARGAHRPTAPAVEGE